MLKFRNTHFYLLLILSLLLINCNNDNKKQDETEQIDSTIRENSTLVKVNNRLFSVPSPFQVAILIKNNKIPFNKQLLNSEKNQINYTTSYKQALNLGVYGADLSYLNIYEQLLDVASYFAVIKVLSKELGISSTVDEKTLNKIEANSSNKDSLLTILSTIYRDADAFLFNNDRNEIGLLILSGGWIESLYIMTQTLNNYNNQEIINRIGDQKYPLDNIIELLRPYYGKISDEFDMYLESLVDLATIFDGVEIKYKYNEPEVDVENKITIIKSTTETIINEYQIKEIKKSIKKIREEIVN